MVENNPFPQNLQKIEAADDPSPLEETQRVEHGCGLW